ncbi:unnamed protein product [Closterium sp. NIES-53]
MELISSAEGRFVTDGVAQNLRADGRAREVFRPFSLDTGVIPQATGSARLRLGATHILACVKAEIGSPPAGRPWGGRIEVSVDCSPTATPAFRGRGGEELSQELTRVLERSFLGGADGSGPATSVPFLPPATTPLLHHSLHFPPPLPRPPSSCPFASWPPPPCPPKPCPPHSCPSHPCPPRSCLPPSCP